MAVWQSPITLNQFLGTQTVMDEVHVFFFEGFPGVMPNGHPVGVIVFADDEAIRRLEVYSMDGDVPRLPVPESLSAYSDNIG